jgi:hypothetical protein
MGKVAVTGVEGYPILKIHDIFSSIKKNLSGFDCTVRYRVVTDNYRVVES